ncbi:MAG: class I SAM-dependent methyltransferase [Candidatus Aenigmatarchaeota archaeon]
MSSRKQHTNTLAYDYDSYLARALFPKYDEMQGLIVEQIPFSVNDNFTVIDFGIGTAETSMRILKTFLRAFVLGIDENEEMIEIAKKKTNLYDNRIFVMKQDFYTSIPPMKGDAIISSISLHHEEDKEQLFQRFYSTTNTNGVCIVADVVTYKDKEKTMRTEQEWKDYLIRTLGKKQAVYRFDEFKIHDKPSPLEDQLKWMKQAGYVNVRVFWECMNYAAFVGYKNNLFYHS